MDPVTTNCLQQKVANKLQLDTSHYSGAQKLSQMDLGRPNPLKMNESQLKKPDSDELNISNLSLDNTEVKLEDNPPDLFEKLADDLETTQMKCKYDRMIEFYHDELFVSNSQYRFERIFNQECESNNKFNYVPTVKEMFLDAMKDPNNFKEERQGIQNILQKESKHSVSERNSPIYKQQQKKSRLKLNETVDSKQFETELNCKTTRQDANHESQPDSQVELCRLEPDILKSAQLDSNIPGSLSSTKPEINEVTQHIPNSEHLIKSMVLKPDSLTNKKPEINEVNQHTLNLPTLKSEESPDRISCTQEQTHCTSPPQLRSKLKLGERKAAKLSEPTTPSQLRSMLNSHKRHKSEPSSPPQLGSMLSQDKIKEVQITEPSSPPKLISKLTPDKRKGTQLSESTSPPLVESKLNLDERKVAKLSEPTTPSQLSTMLNFDKRHKSEPSEPTSPPNLGIGSMLNLDRRKKAQFSEPSSLPKLVKKVTPSKRKEAKLSEPTTPSKVRSMLNLDKRSKSVSSEPTGPPKPRSKLNLDGRKEAKLSEPTTQSKLSFDKRNKSETSEPITPPILGSKLDYAGIKPQLSEPISPTTLRSKLNTDISNEGKLSEPISLPKLRSILTPDRRKEAQESKPTSLSKLGSKLNLDGRKETKLSEPTTSSKLSSEKRNKSESCDPTTPPILGSKLDNYRRKARLSEPISPPKLRSKLNTDISNECNLSVPGSPPKLRSELTPNKRKETLLSQPTSPPKLGCKLNLDGRKDAKLSEPTTPSKLSSDKRNKSESSEPTSSAKLDSMLNYDRRKEAQLSEPASPPKLGSKLNVDKRKDAKWSEPTTPSKVRSMLNVDKRNKSEPSEPTCPPKLESMLDYDRKKAQLSEPTSPPKLESNCTKQEIHESRPAETVCSELKTDNMKKKTKKSQQPAITECVPSSQIHRENIEIESEGKKSFQDFMLALGLDFQDKNESVNSLSDQGQKLLYACDYCENVFGDKGSLIFHLVSHKFIRNTRNPVLKPLVKEIVARPQNTRSSNVGDDDNHNANVKLFNDSKSSETINESEQVKEDNNMKTLNDTHSSIHENVDYKHHEESEITTLGNCPLEGSSSKRAKDILKNVSDFNSKDLCKHNDKKKQSNTDKNLELESKRKRSATKIVQVDIRKNTEQLKTSKIKPTSPNHSQQDSSTGKSHPDKTIAKRGKTSSLQLKTNKLAQQDATSTSQPETTNNARLDFQDKNESVNSLSDQGQKLLYACDYCENVFGDKGSLIFHLVSHKFIRNTRNPVLKPLVKEILARPQNTRSSNVGDDDNHNANVKLFNDSKSSETINESEQVKEDNNMKTLNDTHSSIHENVDYKHHEESEITTLGNCPLEDSSSKRAKDILKNVSDFNSKDLCKHNDKKKQSNTDKIFEIESKRKRSATKIVQVDIRKNTEQLKTSKIKPTSPNHSQQDSSTGKSHPDKTIAKRGKTSSLQLKTNKLAQQDATSTSQPETTNNAQASKMNDSRTNRLSHPQQKITNKHESNGLNDSQHSKVIKVKLAPRLYKKLCEDLENEKDKETSTASVTTANRSKCDNEQNVEKQIEGREQNKDIEDFSSVKETFILALGLDFQDKNINILNHQAQEISYACGYCENMFDDKGSLIFHLASHKFLRNTRHPVLKPLVKEILERCKNTSSSYEADNDNHNANEKLLNDSKASETINESEQGNEDSSIREKVDNRQQSEIKALENCPKGNSSSMMVKNTLRQKEQKSSTEAIVEATSSNGRNRKFAQSKKDRTISITTESNVLENFSEPAACPDINEENSKIFQDKGSPNSVSIGDEISTSITSNKLRLPKKNKRKLERNANTEDTCNRYYMEKIPRTDEVLEEKVTNLVEINRTQSGKVKNSKKSAMDKIKYLKKLKKGSKKQSNKTMKNSSKISSAFEASFNSTHYDETSNEHTQFRQILTQNFSSSSLEISNDTNHDTNDSKASEDNQLENYTEAAANSSMNNDDSKTLEVSPNRVLGKEIKSAMNSSKLSLANENKRKRQSKVNLINVPELNTEDLCKPNYEEKQPTTEEVLKEKGTNVVIINRNESRRIITARRSVTAKIKQSNSCTIGTVNNNTIEGNSGDNSRIIDDKGSPNRSLETNLKLSKTKKRKLDNTALLDVCPKSIKDIRNVNSNEAQIQTGEELGTNESGISEKEPKTNTTKKGSDSAEKDYTKSNVARQNVNTVTSTKEDTFICNNCGRILKSKYMLISHLKTHSEKSSLKSKNKRDLKFKCKTCKSRFATQSELLNHEVKAHDFDKSYRACTICGYKTPYPYRLTAHMLAHNNIKPFECNYCKKEFRTGNDLKLHVRTHTGETPYQCEFCLLKFSRRPTLNRHLKTHKGERPYKCVYCAADFKLVITLKHHLNTHADERPFKCSNCPSKFRDTSALEEHMRSHKGEKPYKCYRCEYSSASRHGLQRHAKTHEIEASDVAKNKSLLAERPHKCTVCTASFTLLSHLKRHLNIHFKEKFYKCTTCSSSFSDGSSLKRHMKCHTGEKPYRCNQCEYTTANNFDLTRHAKLHLKTNNKK